MTWTLPATGGISSPYGHRILAGAIGTFHYGVDLRAKRGPVRAAQDGIVRTIFQTAKGAWVVDLRHADEAGRQIRTRYVHMYRNEIRVTVGQTVRAGDQIGTSGASGTTAAHLHYEVLVDGVLVDPVPFMRARGVDLDAQTVTNPGPTTGAVPTVPGGSLPDPLTPDPFKEIEMTSFVRDALESAYFNEIGRTPTLADLAPRIQRCAQADDPMTQLRWEIAQIDRSQESNRYAVRQVYQELFSRTGTQADWDYWVQLAGVEDTDTRHDWLVAEFKKLDEYKKLQAKG